MPKSGREAARKQEFYEAMLIELQAAITYIGRYAKLAKDRAEEEKDPKRREEIKTMAENCRQLTKGTPKTFWQALQLWHFATTITLIESNGHSVSYGRMDQWLYPFYEKDMENGTITKDFAQELLECAYVKMGNPSKLKDRSYRAGAKRQGLGR